MKKKRVYILCFVALLLVEVLIALFVHDRFVRPYVGDVLITVLLCCFARCIWPNGVLLLPLWVFLFSAAVEFSQLLGFAERLGIHGGVLGTIFGATFDWVDILCYAVGCGLFFVTEGICRRRNTK